MQRLSLNRRTVLKALAHASLLPLCGTASAAFAADAAVAAHKVSDRITLITGAGGNVVVFKGDKAVTLIDSGESSKTAALLKLVDEISGKLPITTVINTHWHDDHTGGNEALHARGARIIAHENTRLWLGAEFEVYWRNKNFRPRPKTAWPDQTTYEGGKLDAGGETLEYQSPAQAHTDGDLYVFFPTSNVLVAGGLLCNKQYPVCDIATGGWIGGLIAANKTMLALANDKTLIVPDRGPALAKADLKAQHDMLNDLYEQMKELMQNGYSDVDMLKETKFTAKYDATYGSPTEFIKETYRGMAAHTYDMGGFI